MAEPIEKVSIVVSHGSLEGVYPGLIMANGARMEGIEATLFFTFFGLDAIIDKRMDKLSVATVGNSAMRMPGGLKMPTLLGAVPGMSRFATTMMSKEMEKLDIPPIDPSALIDRIDWTAFENALKTACNIDWDSSSGSNSDDAEWLVHAQDDWGDCGLHTSSVSCAEAPLFRAAISFSSFSFLSISNCGAAMPTSS